MELDNSGPLPLLYWDDDTRHIKLYHLPHETRLQKTTGGVDSSHLNRWDLGGQLTHHYPEPLRFQDGD